MHIIGTKFKRSHQLQPSPRSKLMGKTQKHKNTPSTFQKIHLQVYLIFDYIMKVLESPTHLQTHNATPRLGKRQNMHLKYKISCSTKILHYNAHPSNNIFHNFTYDPTHHVQIKLMPPLQQGKTSTECKTNKDTTHLQYHFDYLP